MSLRPQSCSTAVGERQRPESGQPQLTPTKPSQFAARGVVSDEADRSRFAHRPFKVGEIGRCTRDDRSPQWLAKLKAQPGQAIHRCGVDVQQDQSRREVVGGWNQITQRAAFPDEDVACDKLSLQLRPPKGTLLKNRDARGRLRHDSGQDRLQKKTTRERGFRMKSSEVRCDRSSLSIVEAKRMWIRLVICPEIRGTWAGCKPAPRQRSQAVTRAGNMPLQRKPVSNGRE